MPLVPRLVPAIVTVASLLTPAVNAQDTALLSRAERTDYEETSRYDEVTAFVGELQRRSDLVRVESFGTTTEGRALPLLVLSNPAVATPDDARRSGKPIVFVMANIHGGEVEGKESTFVLSRRLTLGDLRPLLDTLIVLVAPIYNADGNERIDVQNRTAQYGPSGGVGRRENAGGLDLNRDYIKAEAPETIALLGLLRRWDPLVSVDLHTTNGSYHGYHLTYSIPLNPTTDARLLAYHRERLMPALTSALARRQFRSYYYGNFTARPPADGQPDTRTWRAFTHQPRIGQNYVGLRNRFAILSEAYSYLSFRRRIEVTTAFTEEILKYVAANAAEMLDVARGADLRAVTRAAPLELGVAYEARALPEPVDLLVGEVEKKLNPRSGKEWTVALEDRFTPVRMPDVGTFAATRSVTVPAAYACAPAASTQVVLDKLAAHGITVEELTADATLEAEEFVVGGITRAERRFQGHNEVKLAGEYRTRSATLPAGTILVRTAQPLGALAAYLLDPESEDGIVTWNFLDPVLEVGAAVPILRIPRPPMVTSRVR